MIVDNNEWGCALLQLIWSATNSFPRHLWMWINVHTSHVPVHEMTNKTWIFWTNLFLFFLREVPGIRNVCKKKREYWKKPSPDNYTVQQCSHTSELVFVCFSVFKKYAWGYVVLHMWRLESDAAFFLFCLFWHFLKHDRSQECKISPPVSWGDAHTRCPCCCCTCRACTWTRK